MVLFILAGLSAILFFFAFFDDKGLKKLKLLLSYIFIVFCLLAILLCIDTIDYQGYREMYFSVGSLKSYNSDILFNGLIMIHKMCLNNFHSFYLGIGIINMLLLFALVNSVEADQRIAFCVLYFSFFFLLKDCIQIRNALALKLVLLSTMYFFSKKYRLFILFYLAAVLTHNSMIVFLPCFFLYRKSVPLVLIIILLILYSLSYFKIKGIFHILISYMPLFQHRIAGMVPINADALSKFHFFKIIFYCLLFSLCQDKYDAKTRFFYWCVLSGYTIRIFSSDASFLGGRIAENLYVGEPFLICHLINIRWPKGKKVFMRIFMLLYLSINLHMLFKNLDLIHSYKTILG
jgi:hypothetical protein